VGPRGCKCCGQGCCAASSGLLCWEASGHPQFNAVHAALVPPWGYVRPECSALTVGNAYCLPRRLLLQVTTVLPGSFRIYPC